MTPVTFDFLLVSSDYDLLKAVTAAVKQLDGKLNVVTSAATARDYVKRRKLDGIVLDLSVPGAMDVIAEIRDGHSNRFATIFTAVANSTESAAAISAGANHAVQRPVTTERASAAFEAARGTMTRERRRYFRHEVDFAVKLATAGVAEHKATVTNLSEGGMAVRGGRKLPPSSMIEFSFELPSTPGVPIRGKGEVAWANEGALGIRFHVFLGGGERQLLNWLQAREMLPA